MIEQPSMFPDDYADEVIPDKATAPDLIVVPKPAEWMLLRRGRSIRGWHKIKSSGPFGEQYALCGLVGAAVREDEKVVPLCPECARLQHRPQHQ